MPGEVGRWPSSQKLQRVVVDSDLEFGSRHGFLSSEPLW